jgi:hypothetical protein
MEKIIFANALDTNQNPRSNNRPPRELIESPVKWNKRFLPEKGPAETYDVEFIGIKREKILDFGPIRCVNPLKSGWSVARSRSACPVLGCFSPRRPMHVFEPTTSKWIRTLGKNPAQLLVLDQSPIA